jgi:hypothetical protein
VPRLCQDVINHEKIDALLKPMSGRQGPARLATVTRRPLGPSRRRADALRRYAGLAATGQLAQYS